MWHHDCMKDHSINSVAARAGVSIATVSRVLNNSKPVSAPTRERVLESVQALGFRANVFGRSLRKAESRLILVLVPDFSNPYYAEIVQGIDLVMRERGYNILLAGVSDNWTQDTSTLNLLNNKLADGVISLAHIEADAGIMGALKNTPWVACSEAPSIQDIPFVSIDHRQAAMDAVQYLLNQGHQRIALISADETYQWASLRHQGYVQVLQRAGMEIDPELIRVANKVEYAQGVRAAASLLSLPNPPTAVFAVADTLAIGAIKTFKKAGKRVPQDIAVIGFDNVPIAEVFEPSLTTIGQPMRELGGAAAQTLLALLEGKNPASQTLAHSLILRNSA